MASRDQHPYQRHDHQHCIDHALLQAQQICRERGVRLTEIRQRVLELIWQSHRPSGAYDLMEKLGQEGRNSAPPTVYRALDFLQEQGLVHRIASLNAFIGCIHPGEHHRSGFLLCRGCGAALEMDLHTLLQDLEQSARGQHFAIEQVLVEVTGLCPACHGQEPPQACRHAGAEHD
jgi:Fur family transcriptional regulator, zinc uptake regulator